MVCFLSQDQHSRPQANEFAAFWHRRILRHTHHQEECISDHSSSTCFRINHTAARLLEARNTDIGSTKDYLPPDHTATRCNPRKTRKSTARSSALATSTPGCYPTVFKARQRSNCIGRRTSATLAFPLWKRCSRQRAVRSRHGLSKNSNLITAQNGRNGRIFTCDPAVPSRAL